MNERLQVRPALRQGVRLQHDRARDQWVLLAPERVVELDDIALAIVQLFDGERSIEAIADTLAREYDADPGEIAADISDLVEHLRSKHLLKR